MCDVGQVAPKGAAACEDCRERPGHRANAEQSRCVACSAGEYADADATACLPCPASGVAGAGERSVSCGACDAGFAPDAALTVLRVCDSQQSSATAWFLDGFNYALRRRFDLINLSVGGPDFRDVAFADKVRQLAASGATCKTMVP